MLVRPVKETEATALPKLQTLSGGMGGAISKDKHQVNVLLPVP